MVHPKTGLVSMFHPRIGPASLAYPKIGPVSVDHPEFDPFLTTMSPLTNQAAFLSTSDAVYESFSPVVKLCTAALPNGKQNRKDRTAWESETMVQIEISWLDEQMYGSWLDELMCGKKADWMNSYCEMYTCANNKKVKALTIQVYGEIWNWWWWGKITKKYTEKWKWNKQTDKWSQQQSS